jgi:hypothetical protein
VTKILPVIVTPENSMSHRKSVNFTTLLLAVIHVGNYKNMTVTAKFSNMEDQMCDECNLENLW